MKRRILPIFFIYWTIGFCLVFDIPVNDINYYIEKHQGYDRICLEGGIQINNPGAPEIKYLVYNYALPSDQSIKQIRILEQEWEEIPGEYIIFPEQKYCSLEKTPQFTEINPTIYTAQNPYPELPLINYSTGNMRGYNLCQIAVSPFQYVPRTKKLSILRKLKLKMETVAKNYDLKVKRQSTYSQQIFSKIASTLTINEPNPPECYICANPEDLSPTDLPSLMGPPVDLVIITTENLVQGYEKFARIKKLLGFNTVIKTLPCIRQYYSGIDDAEKIRNFIKDAVEKWGTSFVLLGGDVPEIPTRSVWLAWVDPDQWPENIVTDLYYSCLDGNWNFDGDSKFGEVADSVDLYPDVFVGRLTLKHLDEVVSYTNKNFKYNFPEYSGIQIKTLFVTSNLFYPNDAFELAVLLSGYLPPWFDAKFLNERPLQNFKDSIYTGYGIIQAIGHGDVNLWRVNSNPQYATNFFFDSLTNYNKYPLMITISCYTNPFQSDCLGEHFVNNPNGGGIAYIGPTGTSEGYLHTAMTINLYRNLFSHPLAGALGVSKIPYIPNASGDSWYRFYLYAINLIGDPTITIWDSIPNIFDTVTVNPDTINVGTDTIAIAVKPLVNSFDVIYYKENDVFARDSGFAGSIVSEIKTKSPGYLKFTIISKRFAPYIDSVYVKPARPYLAFDYFTIRDSLNNQNGIMNPGEDIFLYVSLKNTGGGPAENITASITCSDSFINLITDSASYLNIKPDSTRTNLTPFHFQVTNSIPDEHSLNFCILTSYNNETSFDSFQIIASSPQLRLFTQFPMIKGDTIFLFPYIENRGSYLADSVKCIINSQSDTITVIDSIANFPIILPDSIGRITDTLSLILNYPGTLKYNFRAYYRNSKIFDKNIKIQSLPKPDSVATIGLSKAISLKWKPVTGAIGYRIYRATNLQGPYKLLNNHLVSISYFEDFNIIQSFDYYYYLYAVDSSMNNGISSDTIKARTNPMIASGWPRAVYGYPYTSPNFGDLDPNYPGLEIAIATRDDGAIYAWHCDGTPIVQTPYSDGRIFVAGGPLWASPAIGDINNDGKMDIVFGVRRTTNNLYAITCYDTIWLPMPNWPISVPGNVFSAPVLGDLDNNGNLEIVVRTEQADIYAFRYDASGYFSSSGLLFNGPGFAYGAPAIGDVNRDGNLEIVSCGGSGSESLYVWDRYGNYLSPFPIFIRSARNLRCATILGNIIGDVRLEIAFFVDSTIYVISPDGTILWSKNLPSLEFIESYPVFADITGDHRPEIICGESKTGILAVFDSLGNFISNFPMISTEHDWRRLICADLNADNISDLIVPANNWKVYGYDCNSQSLPGFPVELGNYINSSPAVYDIDFDGKLELMIAPCDFKFYVFELNTTKYEWPRFRYDQYNSGLYKSENLVGIQTAFETDKKLHGLTLAVFPNPFNKTLTIKFQIPNPKMPIPSANRNPKSNSETTRSPLGSMTENPTASIKIFDICGRLVKSFNHLSANQRGGNHQFNIVVWSGDDNNGRKMPAGVYFVKLEGNGFSKIEKIVLIK